MMRLAVFALADEVVPVEGFTPLVTGVGKVAATLALTEAIAKERPECVLNVGTAGTFRRKVGDIVACRRFVDRDFARLPLPGIGWELGQDGPSVSTGDNFVTGGEDDGCDVVDMEAFALARVCAHFGVPFACVKYVTDIIGQNSVALWEAKLAEARERLTLYFERYGTGLLYEPCAEAR